MNPDALCTPLALRNAGKLVALGDFDDGLFPHRTACAGSETASVEIAGWAAKRPAASAGFDLVSQTNKLYRNDGRRQIELRLWAHNGVTDLSTQTVPITLVGWKRGFNPATGLRIPAARGRRLLIATATLGASYADAVHPITGVATPSTRFYETGTWTIDNALTFAEALDDGGGDFEAALNVDCLGAWDLFAFVGVPSAAMNVEIGIAGLC